MRNLWNKPGIPHKGWVLNHSEDLGHPDGICGMCGKTHLRYMHHITHPTGIHIATGSKCASKLTTDSYILSEIKQAESNLRKQAKLKKQQQTDKIKWLEKKWSVLPTVNKHFKVSKYFFASYTSNNTGWKYKGVVEFGGHKFKIKSMLEDSIRKQAVTLIENA